MVTEIGEQVQKFYNKIPFPDYDLDQFNDKEDLVIKAGEFPNILDRSIPQKASIIDVGTGTGQLSAYLSLRRKKVFGIDFSDSSLNKAKALKKKLKLNSLTLKKVDILDSKQIEKLGKFDYVLCLGVLHHTGNAYKAFKNILKLLKPNGYIAVGLYNRVGRIPLKVRIALSNTVFKNDQKIKDYFIKLQIGDVEDKERARGWWHDQYQHVHETTHTVGEVRRWFKKNNIECLETVPVTEWNTEGVLSIGGVFSKEGYSNFLIRFYRQLTWLWKTHREGGYWITFGRKK